MFPVQIFTGDQWPWLRSFIASLLVANAMQCSAMSESTPARRNKRHHTRKGNGRAEGRIHHSREGCAQASTRTRRDRLMLCRSGSIWTGWSPGTMYPRIALLHKWKSPSPFSSFHQVSRYVYWPSRTETVHSTPPMTLPPFPLPTLFIFLTHQTPLTSVAIRNGDHCFPFSSSQVRHWSESCNSHLPDSGSAGMRTPSMVTSGAQFPIALSMVLSLGVGNSGRSVPQ